MILASASQISLLLTAAAALAYLLPAVLPGSMGPRGARTVVLVAWLLHGVLLALGLLGGSPQDPPRFGFAPALSVTAWLVTAVYAVESLVFPQLRTHWALSGLGDARAEIDALNVFPVPDGDTGTNMALTLKSVVEELAGDDGHVGAHDRDVGVAGADVAFFDRGAGAENRGLDGGGEPGVVALRYGAGSGCT